MTNDHDQNVDTAPEEVAAPAAISPAVPPTAPAPPPAEPAGEPASGSNAPLTALEVRVLGSLIEKECTTPDTYPMSLNALVLACNQKSNRAPLMEVDAVAVTNALDSLREKKYVWVVTGGVSSRVPKYQHDLAKRLQVSGGARAILCELCLRGPQTVAELRARSARMHSFTDAAEFEQALNDLLNRPTTPLVARVAAAPGQRGMRYAHLLSGPVSSLAASEQGHEPSEPPPPPRADRIAEIEKELAALQADVAALRAQVEGIRFAPGV